MRHQLCSIPRFFCLSFCLIWAINFSACKPENEEPYQIKVATNVPEVVWTHHRNIPIDASSSSGQGVQSRLTFLWSWMRKPDGAEAPRFENSRSARTVIDRFNMAGNYILQLQVTDQKGASVLRDFTITVVNDTLPDIPPRADAGDDLELNLPRKDVNLSGLRSYAMNPEGRSIQFNWTLLSKPQGSAEVRFLSPASPECTVTGFNKTGSYHFQLEVKNELGRTAVDTVTVVVKPDPLQGKSFVYEDITWLNLQEFASGQYKGVMLVITDFNILDGRQASDFEVNVWDESRGDWFSKDQYPWEYYEDEWFGNLILVHNLPAPDSIYYSIVGHKTRVRVTIL